MNKLTIIKPDDWHLHLRDSPFMEAVVADSARQFGRAIIMPNLVPPVRSCADALAYRQRICSALPSDSPFNPLMTLYLTDNTSVDEIRAASESEFIHGAKLYPAGATTNSDAGVTDLAKLGPCSRRCKNMASSCRYMAKPPAPKSMFSTARRSSSTTA